MPFLIVNADDFGQAPGINRGVVAAHERGVVTSASLMVRWPAAAEAAAYARAHRELAVGLHLDLGEWCLRDGEWVARYRVVDTDDADAVERELAAQLETFRALLGRPPSHLDSHQHVHRSDPAASLVAAAAADLGVPLRDRDPRVCYRGDFYGQDGHGAPYPEGITVDAFERVVSDLAEGWTELACHPGEPDDALASTYRAERQLELAVLCDDRARDAIRRHDVELVSFADVTAA